MTAAQEKVSSITIIGRRWFRRGPGNTYHSAEIIVNGTCVHKIEFAYGYGNQYEWNAFGWLEENGYMPGREHGANGSREAGWRYCERHSIALSSSGTDVTRKRDL